MDFSRIDSDTSADPDLVGVDNRVFRLGLEGLKLGLKLSIGPIVIAVKKRYPESSTGPDSQIAGRADSLVGLTKVAEAGLLIVGHQVGSSVVGTIVDHD